VVAAVTVDPSLECHQRPTRPTDHAAVTAGSCSQACRRSSAAETAAAALLETDPDQTFLTSPGARQQASVDPDL